MSIRLVGAGMLCFWLTVGAGGCPQSADPSGASGNSSRDGNSVVNIGDNGNNNGTSNEDDNSMFGDDQNGTPIRNDNSDDRDNLTFNFRAGETNPPPEFFFSFRTVINFDRLPSGAAIPDNTVITDQFRSQGVVFSTRLGRARTVRGNDNDRSGWGADWTSEPNTLGIENSTLLVAEFVGSTPDRVGVVFVDSPHNDPFTIRAFDADGIVVDEQTVNSADTSAQSVGNAEDIFLGVVHDRGIARVEMSVAFISGGGLSGWEIDDFQFGQ
ncbi:MAG: hypothetical protein JNG88_02845 [Phycisphaerales bacterium]|nr:hypothetical protein [Phycisphaerales bacterium]